MRVARSLSIPAVLTAAAVACGAAAEAPPPAVPAAERSEAPPPAASAAESSADAYLLYVGAESADLLHRVRFTPGEGARVENTVRVGEIFVEMEGPHGVAVDTRRDRLYMTTGHGVPDGKLWAYETGPDTAVAEPRLLGPFPATVDVTPDGMFVIVANFNLHGEMEPSSISVVLADGLTEVARVETCAMPHGSRVSPDGIRHYSACMMDDQVVELDIPAQRVARRFSVARGEERPLDPADRGHPRPGLHHPYRASCSPTWADTDPDARWLYVACNRSDEVLEIDLESWELERRFSTGRGPYNLQVTPDGATLVVTLKQGDAVEFIDLERGETAARTPTSTTVVHGVAIAPDSRYAFVSVEGVGAEPGKVDVFELETFRRVADVEVGKQASGIAFWRTVPASEQVWRADPGTERGARTRQPE